MSYLTSLNITNHFTSYKFADFNASFITCFNDTRHARTIFRLLLKAERAPLTPFLVPRTEDRCSLVPEQMFIKVKSSVFINALEIYRSMSARKKPLRTFGLTKKYQVRVPRQSTSLNFYLVNWSLGSGYCYLGTLRQYFGWKMGCLFFLFYQQWNTRGCLYLKSQPISSFGSCSWYSVGIQFGWLYRVHPRRRASWSDTVEHSHVQKPEAVKENKVDSRRK